MRLADEMARILELDAFAARLDANLAKKKANRPANSERSRKGWKTRQR